jgi:branched-chain amino acid transport system permease protein
MNFHELFSNLGDLTVDGLAKGSIYALVALGYTLVYGVLKLINFAHSEIFMVGTWVVFGTYSMMGVSASSGALLIVVSMLLALVLAAAGSAGTALAVERVAYRPLRKRNAPPLIFLITAIGCSMVLQELFGQAFHDLFGQPFGRAGVSIPTLISTKELITIGDTTITNIQFIIIVAAVAMMIGLDQFVNRSRLGRGVRAVAQDPDTASLMGVNRERVIMLIFVLGGAMAGVAAMLYEIKYGFTKFDIGFLIGIKAFTAAVLGGIGSLPGAMLGGLLIGLIETFWSAYFSVQYKDVAAFSILVLTLIFLPTGLLGRQEIEKV